MSTAVAAMTGRPRARQSWPDRLRAWVGGSYAPYVFLSPWLAAFAVFMAYPIAYAAWISVHSWTGAGTPKPIGLENYAYILTDTTGFWLSVGNSAYMWVAVVPIQALGGLILAVIVNSPALRGRGIFRTTYFLPYIISLVVVGLVARIMFERSSGVVNASLGGLGIPAIGWLETTEWSKPSIALISLWRHIGYAMVLMLAGLQNIPTQLYEAARVDGAGTVRSFLHITIPLMRRTILFLLIIGTIGSFQMFAEPYLITGGGPRNSSMTAGLYLYNQISFARLGRASANSFVLLALLLVASLLVLRLGRGETEEKS